MKDDEQEKAKLPKSHHWFMLSAINLPTTNITMCLIIPGILYDNTVHSFESNLSLIQATEQNPQNMLKILLRTRTKQRIPLIGILFDYYLGWSTTGSSMSTLHLFVNEYSSIL